MPKRAERLWMAVAGLSGAAAVGADAAARHLLAGEAYRLDLAATGARYGLIHAVALLGVAVLAGAGRSACGAIRYWLAAAGWCFAGGLLLFPGSLYVLAAGGPSELARLAPIGGLLFIAGWLALLCSALVPRRGD